jgi:hypothetical protein
MCFIWIFKMVHLEMVDIDQVNFNAILLLGAHCPNLKKLCLHGCHFQIQPEDSSTIDALCQQYKNNNNNLSGNYIA